MNPSDTDNPDNFFRLFPGELPAPLAGALFELRRAREALDLATVCVNQAVKLAQVNVSPQPFCEADLTEGRDVHLVAKASEKPPPRPR